MSLNLFLAQEAERNAKKIYVSSGSTANAEMPNREDFIGRFHKIQRIDEKGILWAGGYAWPFSDIHVEGEMSPVQEEMCSLIQKGVVEYYGVPVSELITSKRLTEEVERRYVFFYLLKVTKVPCRILSKKLKVPCNTISAGQSYISDKMGIYPHILATLTAIINKIDSFDKNYVWQIAPLSKPKLPS